MLTDIVLPLGALPATATLRPVQITPNGRDVFVRRYVRKASDGTPAETINETLWRVASNVAAAELPRVAPAWAQVYYNLLADLRFLPNSPTFTGAGTPLGQLSACFVLPIEDDMGKTPAGIFQTLRDAALIQQTGGGNGFSFSRLRAKGTRVTSSNGTASGPIGFLRVYDYAFGEVQQGGARRGANMGVLRVEHPDIREFITCKTDESHITNFNISVTITDEFMQAVKADTDFELIEPSNGQVVETVNARELFDLIATHAHANGEPGVLFIDTANRSNPIPHVGDYEATNPCGEQWLLPYESCNLGSINLAVHVTEEGQVDWHKLQETIELATRFLDDVVSVNHYVNAVPQLRIAARRARRIGLGFMGLADMLIHLGLRYGSDEACEFAAQVSEFMQYHAMQTSISMAQERGAFPAIAGSVYDPGALIWSPPRPLEAHSRDFGRPRLDWAAVSDGIISHGIRNAALTTIAPTGTLSTVAGCEGYGCEPVFAFAYTRHVVEGDSTFDLHYASPLHARYADSPSMAAALVTSGDVAPGDHVRMQASIQAFIDNGISKTINMPPTATVDDVTNAYRRAFDLGCKGLTVYVTGSRDKVVLEAAVCPLCGTALTHREGCSACPACGYAHCEGG